MNIARATRSRRSVLAATAVGAAALLAACGSGTPSVNVTVTETAPPPTASAPTTEPEPTDTATTPPAPAYGFGDEWTFAPETDAQGSGCAPGAGPLPDGVWFGFVESWSTSAIEFDLACWWTGAGAATAAGWNVDEALDFYITNDNPALRTVPVAPGAAAKKAGWEDGEFTLAQVIADPGGSLPTAAPYPAWLYVNGGEATAVAVQYVP